MIFRNIRVIILFKVNPPRDLRMQTPEHQIVHPVDPAFRVAPAIRRQGAQRRMNGAGVVDARRNLEDAFDTIAFRPPTPERR